MQINLLADTAERPLVMWKAYISNCTCNFSTEKSPTQFY